MASTPPAPWRLQRWPRASLDGDALSRTAARGVDAVVLDRGDRSAEGRIRDLEAAQGGAPLTDVVFEESRRLREHGLALVLELELDRLDAEAPLARSRPEWFRFVGETGGDPPDPRRPETLRRELAWRTPLDDAALEACVALIDALARAGAQGFLCRAPTALGAQWRTLIARSRQRHPRLRFVADTLGLGPKALHGLRGAGFDATLGSLAWWDGRASWFAQEQTRLLAVAPPLATIRRAPSADGISELRAVETRRRIAMALGHGVLLDESCIEIPPERLDLREPWPAPAHAVSTATGPQSPCGALIVRDARDTRLVLIHPGPERVLSVPAAQLLPRTASDTAHWRALYPPDGSALRPQDALVLEPGEVRVYGASQDAPVRSTRARAAAAAAEDARIAIERCTPCVDEGRYAVKRCVGEQVAVEVDVFADGHAHLGVELLWRRGDRREWQRVRMRALGNDRWAAEFPLLELGRHHYTIEAWFDGYASFRDELVKKQVAGLDLALELREGRALLARHRDASAPDEATALSALLERFDAADRGVQLELLLDGDTAALLARSDPRPFRVRREGSICVDAERSAAGFSSWYELFPRSSSGDPARHGTFADVIGELPRIRDLGFDVLYFTPIHPIGRRHRKGRNNSLKAELGDPGSPYAIGAEEGGHDAIHPELGTLEDFRRLRDAAKAHGLELALDFAIQCSPDHPWLREHPGWFSYRPDGSIRYAENPPKKYEDIVNVDFYAADAVPALWEALRDVVLFWVAEGVELFRVDNPHTKPLPFWEWMIAEVRGRHPRVVFLSEAFTRPKVMYRLAKIGFSQSYTYFTWRNDKRELRAYLEELANSEVRDYFRPHFFVNTPDINPYFLQRSGRPGFLIRAALATTLSGLWGMYRGFELCEARAVPGKEEYLDSEKYELRAWDLDRPGNIAAEIARLNAIRRAHPALQSHLGVHFLESVDDHVLVYEKATPARDDVLVVAVNLDPHQARESDFEAPTWRFGLPDDGLLLARELMREVDERWPGKHRRVRLEPELPFAIWHLRRGDAA